MLDDVGGAIECPTLLAPPSVTGVPLHTELEVLDRANRVALTLIRGALPRRSSPRSGAGHLPQANHDVGRVLSRRLADSGEMLPAGGRVRPTQEVAREDASGERLCPAGWHIVPSSVTR
jgi:hypothetical protein